MDVIAWGVAGVACVTALALAVRGHRQGRSIRDLEEALQRDTDAERTVAASDERNRIAREMHDVVAHTLSVVVAQADGGRFAAAHDPSAAGRALDTVAEVSRSALAEMRALLGTLRTSNDAAPLTPQPHLGDIPALVASARDSGLDVSYVTTGTPRPVPIGAGLAAYRIVQEALTNVRSHAGPTVRAYVQLQWGEQWLEVTISDDGRGAAARGGGNGLGVRGMVERASVFGGTLSAGPKAGGGFLVRARLPLGGPTNQAIDSADTKGGNT